MDDRFSLGFLLGFLAGGTVAACVALTHRVTIEARMVPEITVTDGEHSCSIVTDLRYWLSD